MSLIQFLSMIISDALHTFSKSVIYGHLECLLVILVAPTLFWRNLNQTNQKSMPTWLINTNIREIMPIINSSIKENRLNPFTTIQNNSLNAQVRVCQIDLLNKLSNLVNKYREKHPRVTPGLFFFHWSFCHMYNVPSNTVKLSITITLHYFTAYYNILFYFSINRWFLIEKQSFAVLADFQY